MNLSFSDEPKEEYPHIPGYKIVRVLGEGGMGRVYEAKQESLGRSVAIKAFILKGSPEEVKFFYQRFLAEARVLAHMDGHESIIQIYDLVKDADGNHYIIMELVEGRSLQRALSEGLPLKESVRMIAKAARAIHCAHERGIIHRDLKPGNIMIDARGRAKIMDFGVARVAIADYKTHTGLALGTLAYMSPEHLVDTKNVDARSDVYSLATTLYEIAAGRLPFDDSNPFSLANKIQFETPEPPAKLREGIDPRLETIIARGMAKRPEERYQSAAALADALEEWDKLPEPAPAPTRSDSSCPRSSPNAATRSVSGAAQSADFSVTGGAFALIPRDTGAPLGDSPAQPEEKPAPPEPPLQRSDPERAAIPRGASALDSPRKGTGAETEPNQFHLKEIIILILLIGLTFTGYVLFKLSEKQAASKTRPTSGQSPAATPPAIFSNLDVKVNSESIFNPKNSRSDGRLVIETIQDTRPAPPPSLLSATKTPEIQRNYPRR